MQHTVTNSRIIEIDIVRGIAIILMIIGHVDIVFNLLSYGAEGFAGVYRDVTDIYSYLLRAIRIPATVLFFAIAGVVMGVNVYRYHSGLSARQIPLVKRALYLIGLQLTLVSFIWAWIFPTGSWHVTFGVLGTFGVIFLILTILNWMHPYVLGIVGGVILFVRETYTTVYQPTGYLFFDVITGVLWTPYQTQFITYYYPVVSWLAVVLVGVSLGYWYAQKKYTHQAVSGYMASGAIGCASIFLFVRAYGHGWGNFGEPWSMSWSEFLLLSKYPPSVLFVLFGFAWLLLLLWFIPKITHYSVCGHISVIGRYPLEVYVIHLVLVACMTVLVEPQTPSLQLGLFTLLLTVALLYLCYGYCALRDRFSR